MTMPTPGLNPGRLLARVVAIMASVCVLAGLAGSLAAQPHGSAPVAATAGTVQANGVTLAYESFGPAHGETVLLIAGTGMQLTGWPDELVEALAARGYRVVRYDNRDVGLSSTFDEAGWPDYEALFTALFTGQPLPLPYTIDDMVGDAVGLLDALGIGQAHVVGASMGGTIAQLLAADHPERVLSLTSISADSGDPVLPAVADEEALAVIPPLEPGMSKEAYVERQVISFQVIGSPRYPVPEETRRLWVQRDVERAFSPAGEARQSAAVLMAHFIDRTPRLAAIQAYPDPPRE